MVKCLALDSLLYSSFDNRQIDFVKVITASNRKNLYVKHPAMIWFNQ